MNHFNDDDAPEEYTENRTLIGRIERVITPEDSNLGYWAVDVSGTNNAQFREIIYTGGIQFDPDTQNPHGIWIPPKKYNTVILTFIDERPDFPAMISAAPMATRNTGLLNYEQMKKLHATKLLGNEVALFHSNGNKIVISDTEIKILKDDKILTISATAIEIKKGSKVLQIDDNGIYGGSDGGTPDKMISYTKLSTFLQTVVGNLGAPLFPAGLPESVTFDDFFGGI